jgi:signal transduction histidine kinase
MAETALGFRPDGAVSSSDQDENHTLASYRDLAEFRDVSDLDIPSDLLARRNAGDALHAAGRPRELGREASALARDLLASTWSIDRVAWDLTAADIERWLGVPIDVPPARRTFSLLAEALWREFRAGAMAGHPSHRVIDVDGTSITVLVRPSPDGFTAVAVSPEALHAWITDAVSGAYADGARLAIASPSGTLLAGTAVPSGVPTIRLASSDTALPWALTLHSDSWSRAGEQIEYRRLLLTIGLVSILLLLGGGSCVLWLVVRRELAVSRLQTEFVAAVSHEFRTPLTSLRHVTELLEEDDEMPPGKRRTFYEVYRRNTERLHQLVESLLDFARMEAGRRPYERQPIDAATFATDVVAAFERHGAPGLGRVELDVSAAAGLQLQGDRDALVNALGNLLDNAVKYSPDGRPIDVTVRPHPSGVAIAVRDQGLGIVRHEREAIFQRFVRGTQARELGIKGTGLGLAMVAHIVRAHEGTIAVESDEGVGSTFTIVLPAQMARPDGGARLEPA